MRRDNSDERGANKRDLRESLIEAELKTGVHETTIREAERHVVFRIGRIFVGSVVTIIGIILMPLPGPGGLVVAAGLVILSRDVAWADRALRLLRKYSPGIPEDGKVPRSTIVVGVLLMTAGAIAAWWVKGNLL